MADHEGAEQQRDVPADVEDQEGGQPHVGSDLAEARSSDRWPGDALRATAVSRAFAGIHALRGVTLELHRHEVVGLIGPNGAGKTTLVNVLIGLRLSVRRDGRARGPGHHVVEPAPPRPQRPRAHVPAQPVVRRADRARERRGRRARLGRSARVRRAGAPTTLLELLGLEHRGAQPAGSLAHGDERKLGVARALATRAALPAPRRAGRRAARGRGAGVRGGRPLGARRARGGRAPDRPQHGARDGRLRPDPGARPGHARSRRGRRRRSARTSTSPPRTSARRRWSSVSAPCSSSTKSRSATARSPAVRGLEPPARAAARSSA